MKILKFPTSFFVLGTIVFANLFFAQQAQAATGFCKPVTGSAKRYQFRFDPTLADPSQNIAGKVILDAAKGNWNNGSDEYDLDCDCSGGSAGMGAAYVTATLGNLGTPVFTSTSTDDGYPMEYFALNEYLGVATEVFVGGFLKRLRPAPFSNISNKHTEGFPCKSNFSSGSQGRIHIYFRRPFVGVSKIPPTKLVDITISSINGVSSPIIVSTVSMSGTVTVPQNCEINPSPVIIDFGEIMSSDIKAAGVKARGFTKVNKQLELSCRNISDGVKLNLSFQAVPDPIFSDALETDNKDVAIRIESKDGKIIKPNDGRLPVIINYETQKAHTEMNIYPINTTGEIPDSGVFNSTATIRVEMQ